MLIRKNLFYLISIMVISGLVTRCETADDNKLAEAQACMDRLGANPSGASAQACEAKIAGINSADAYAIRCSVGFIVGGVTSTALLAAYAQAKNAPTSEQPAIYMAALSQNSAANADSTYTMCLNSGISSLVYFAGISRLGTLMTTTAASTDPTTFLATCKSAPNTCDDAAIGQTAVDLGSQYCVGSTGSSIACTALNAAIPAGAGDPAAIAQQLYTLLQ